MGAWIVGWLGFLIPKPYYWIALLLAFVASAGSGFVAGLKVEAEIRDHREAKREAQGRIIVRKINVETVRIEKFYFRKQVARVQLARTVAMEVAAHATMPDPVACHLEPERVRNINAAWGPVAADPGGTDGALPSGAAAHFGLAPDAGAMDHGTWGRLRGLFRAAQPADRPGEGAGSAPGD